MTLRHHSPPAVSILVGPGGLLGAALVVLAFLGLLAVAYIGWVSSGRLAAGVLSGWLLGSVLAVWTWQRLPRGVLRWDTQHWFWRPEQAEKENCVAITALKIVIDVQIAFALQAKSSGKSYFFWVQASTNPHHWLLARRAVYSSPSLMLQPPVQ